MPAGVAPSRRRRMRKEAVLGTAAILATVLVVSTSLVAYARWRSVYGSIKRVAVSSADLGKHRPPYTAALNILVLGSDSQSGNNGHGNASVITGARSDTVMLLHIAPGHQRADIISFPGTFFIKSILVLDSCLFDMIEEREKSQIVSLLIFLLQLFVLVLRSLKEHLVHLVRII